MDASTSNASMDLSANSTTSGAHWDTVPLALLIACPCVISFNGITLFLFISKRHLHQPFNVYLGNLLIANLCLSVLSTPLGIIKSAYRTWWLGSVACTAHLYGNFVMSPAIVHSHLLITIIRIWAVAFPHSYRSYNTQKTSLVVCIAGWVYVHCLCLPGVILDALYYRLPVDAGCFLNIAPLADYHLVIQCLFYLLPNFIIISAYPYLWFMCRRRRFRTVIQPRRNDNADTVEQHRSTLRPHASIALNVLAAPDRKFTSAEKENHYNYMFAVLTLLTGSVTICWTPSNIMFTLDSAGVMQINYQSALFHVTMILSILQPALDPILFAAALSDLRKTILKSFQRDR